MIILESHAIASGSSGKGGGLIARWAEPKCLADQSFELHEQLADQYAGSQRYGYRRVTCGNCTIDCSSPKPNDNRGTASSTGSPEHQPQSLPHSPDWLRTDCKLSYEAVGSDSDTAQCNPYHLTRTMFDQACAAGALLALGSASQILSKGTSGTSLCVEYVDNATLQSKDIMATDVIVTAGPWSSKFTPEAAVSGARCHSIVMRPKSSMPNSLLFMDVTYTCDGVQKQLQPEIYPRSDGTVYACEAADPSFPLPQTSKHVVADPDACDRIHSAVTATSRLLQEAEYETKQVCYQPIVVLDGQRRKLVGPFLGDTSIAGVLVACGHDSWGISNAPATGKALSELVFDGSSHSISIDSLSVEKVMARARR